MTNGIHVELAVSACEGAVPWPRARRRAPRSKSSASTQTTPELSSSPPIRPRTRPAALDPSSSPARRTVATRLPASAPRPTAASQSTRRRPKQAPTPVRPRRRRPPSRPPRNRRRRLCDNCSCGGLPSAFANFPVSPRRTEMEDGELLVSFVLTGHEELQAIVDECEAAGLGVERAGCASIAGTGSATDDSCRDVVPVDLAGVTDRQAERSRPSRPRRDISTVTAPPPEIARGSRPREVHGLGTPPDHDGHALLSRHSGTVLKPPNSSPPGIRGFDRSDQ